MSTLEKAAIGLVFVSVLVANAQTDPVAPSESNPALWLDAFNRNICGRRSSGRPFVMPTFPPSDNSHSNGTDYADYFGDLYGDDYADQHDHRDGPRSDELATGRQRNRASVGFNAMPGEVPWHAQLTVFFGWLGLYYHNVCGGVLIHKNLVLTAAHCLMDSGGWRAQRLWIRLGLYNWHEYKGRQWISYSKYCLPKEYKPGQFKHGDIAVIRLEEPAIYDKYVQPACMPGKMEPVKREECMAGGMGMFSESDGRPSRYLRVMPVSWCGKRSKAYGIPPDQSCWISSDEKHYAGSLCKGDSGSGVYCPDDQKSNLQTQFTSMGVLSNTQIGACDEGHVLFSYFSDFGLMHDKIMQLVEECSK